MQHIIQIVVAVLIRANILLLFNLGMRVALTQKTRNKQNKIEQKKIKIEKNWKREKRKKLKKEKNWKIEIIEQK